jgi:hypothetical protein
VPSIALSSLGVKDIFHTPADTIEWLSPDKVVEAVLLAQDLIRILDEKEFNWNRA